MLHSEATLNSSEVGNVFGGLKAAFHQHVELEGNPEGIRGRERVSLRDALDLD